MADQSGPNPSEVPATDVGDETARRYAYQWWYTAIIACGLLDDETGLVEVYCEHHEDILIRYRHGKCRGIQVKTRALGLELWKAGDDEMLASVCRFVMLERDFPDHFLGYTIATNHQFWEGKTNGSNLPHLLNLARQVMENLEGEWPPILRAYCRKIATKTGCQVDVLIRVLAKTTCDHDLPKMDGIKNELCVAIKGVCGADATLTALMLAAETLHAEVKAAASLEHRQSLLSYLSLQMSPEDASLRRTLTGKRLEKERVRRVLVEPLDALSLLVPAQPGIPRPVPAGRTRLDRKLDAGGLSATSVDAARDCYSAALALQLQWAARYGETKALERYNHLRVLVKNEAAIVYEQARREDASFGRTMLAAIRDRLEKRRLDPSTPTFECSDEHLLGYVYMLTDECRVWWSVPFEVGDGT